MKPTRSVLHISIDQKLKADLHKAAKKENRSLANLVETILFRHIEGLDDGKL